jgi:hypothetical protein
LYSSSCEEFLNWKFNGKIFQVIYPLPSPPSPPKIKDRIYSHGMVNISNISNKGKHEVLDLDPVIILKIFIVIEILSYLLAS